MNTKNSSNTQSQELDCWTWGGWEPDRQYRRKGGSSGASYFGNGEWIPEWRERMVNKDTIQWMADSGISLVLTHFYKGFGMKVDGEEWPRVKEYVQECHAKGIKVWGYMQGQSMYQETFFAENPEGVDWVAKQYDGSDRTWGRAYNRLAPCLTAQGYQDYMLSVVEAGLTELDLDGIHLDNSYSKHCYCSRCRRLFRKFLNAVPDLDQRTGIPDASWVEPPPLPTSLEIVSDPLCQLWIEFGTQNRYRFLDALYRRIKQIKPDAQFHTNPAFPKRPASKLTLGLDPVREGQICDFVCCENDCQPRIEQGRLYSQAEAYLYGDAADYRVLHTAWRKGPHGESPAGTPAGFWTGLAEEFSYHAAILGNNWMLRSVGDGDRVLGDDSEWLSAHAEGVHFFRSLHRDLELGNRKQWAEIGIVINVETLSHAGSTDVPAFRALVSHLLTRGVPFRFILAEQDVPDSVTTLFVCQQSCLPESQLERIRDFAAGSGKSAWIAGESGRYDEWFLPRNASRWQAWRRSPGFIADAGDTLKWACSARTGELIGPDVSPGGTDQFGPGDFSVSPEAVNAIDGFFAARDWQPAFSADLPEWILVNTETTSDGRFLIHLRDQAETGKLISGVRLHLDASQFKDASAKLHTPGSKELPLTAIAGPRENTFTLELPDLQHYGLVVLNM